MSATMTPPAPATPDPGGDDTGATDTGPDVLCTITKSGDGTYTVYAGDEPEGDEGGDMAGGAGTGTAPQGVPADSPGAVLKAVLDILKADQSGGGAAEDNFQSGFSGASTPPTAPMGKGM